MSSRVFVDKICTVLLRCGERLFKNQIDDGFTHLATINEFFFQIVALNIGPYHVRIIY